MKECSSKTRAILVSLLVLSLLFSSAVLVMEIVEKVSETNTRDQYTLYIGTNDKDTNSQEIPFDECQMRVEKVCLEYVTGFTLSEGDGVWKDDAGNIVKEQTIICIIDGATADEINSFVDRLLIDLNQSSILIDHQRVSYTYRTR